MKKVLLIYAVLIVAIVLWWFMIGKADSSNNEKGPKEKALTVSKHSKDFNESIEKVMSDYHKVTKNFVNADIISANENANQLKTDLDGLKLDDLKKDTAGIYETAVSFIDNVKGSLQQMIDEATLDSKRRAFKDFSDNLYTFINTVHYDNGALFWIECPTAFGEGNSGFWLSEEQESENPYGQKGCGTAKKAINATIKK